MAAAPLILYAPEGFIRATPEMRDEVCNGCGPAGWKQNYISNHLFGLDVRIACDIHDWMYEFGTTEDDRDEADRIFRNNMLRLIEWAGGPGLLQAARRLKALHYYRLVHNYGAIFFWPGKNEAINEYIIVA